jgi:cobalt-zinc-cadmium efflux system protein
MGHDDRRWLGVGLGLIVAFMAVEVVIGLAAGSLALLSDAGHMLTDAGAVALALVASRLAARPPRGRFTFGLERAEILSAQANGITLLILAVWIGYEAVRRLLHPAAVHGGWVLGTALAGIAVSLVAARVIARADRSSLFGFVATAVAGAVVLLTGFTRADAIVSLLVGLLMVRSGTALLRESGRIFLEAAPSGVDPAALGRELACVAGVLELHDLHVWQVTSGYPALSAHVLVEPGGDCHAVRRDLEARLRAGHAIAHSTLQVDHACVEQLAAGDSHCAESHGKSYRPTVGDTG